VTSDHSPEDSVAEGNFLIPCCAFNIWPSEGTKYPYCVIGCNRGIDPEIHHRNGMVHISLGANSAIVSLGEWAEAVLRFSGQVQHFYDSSMRKDELQDDFDRSGWAFFWQDWSAHRENAKSVARA